MKGRKAPGSKSKQPAVAGSAPAVWTIGHSTRPLKEFIALLQAHQVSCVVDVRTIPRSRHNPQFNAQSLPASLQHAKIGYLHLAELGGLRRTSKASPNAGWRNASFRGFADYMQTAEFEDGLTQLLELAERGRPAVMCAEAVPWRCHRSLIADALLVRGVQVRHIMSPTSAKPHALTPFAKVRGTRITYPKAQAASADQPAKKTSHRKRSKATQS